MKSLPIILTSSPLLHPSKPPTSQTPKFNQPPFTSLTIPQNLHSFSPSLHLSLTIPQILLSPPVLASEFLDSDSATGKIDIESILLSIDNFFNKYPFFVAGCTFIYLVIVPLVIFYLRKYKPISAVNAFRKLRSEPNSQLLDIRDDKTLAALASPDLKFLGKRSVQVPFSESDELGFLEKVKGSFLDPENTVLCILDNFDGNSMKVAELLIENGFKEAYYIKGGARGKNGWLAIQEEFLPPPVHMISTKKVKSSKNKDVSTVGTEN